MEAAEFLVGRRAIDHVERERWRMAAAVKINQI